MPTKLLSSSMRKLSFRTMLETITGASILFWHITAWYICTSHGDDKSNFSTSVSDPASSSFIWEALADGSSAWLSVTHLGGPDGFPDYWLHPVPSLLVAGSWGETQQMATHIYTHCLFLLLFFMHTFCHSIFKVHKNKWIFKNWNYYENIQKCLIFYV